MVDLFFGDGEGPYIPEFDPEWFLENDSPQRELQEQVDKELDEQEVKGTAHEKRAEEVTKVPLSARHGGVETRGKPFERWLEKVLRGEKKITDPLEFTDEEFDRIKNSEL